MCELFTQLDLQRTRFVPSVERTVCGLLGWWSLMASCSYTTHLYTERRSHWFFLPEICGWFPPHCLDSRCSSPKSKHDFSICSCNAPVTISNLLSKKLETTDCFLHLSSVPKNIYIAITSRLGKQLSNFSNVAKTDISALLCLFTFHWFEKNMLAMNNGFFLLLNFRANRNMCHEKMSLCLSVFYLPFRDKNSRFASVTGFLTNPEGNAGIVAPSVVMFMAAQCQSNSFVPNFEMRSTVCMSKVSCNATAIIPWFSRNFQETTRS